MYKYSFVYSGTRLKSHTCGGGWKREESRSQWCFLVIVLGFSYSNVTWLPFLLGDDGCVSLSWELRTSGLGILSSLYKTICGKNAVTNSLPLSHCLLYICVFICCFLLIDELCIDNKYFICFLHISFSIQISESSLGGRGFHWVFYVIFYLLLNKHSNNLLKSGELNFISPFTNG